MGNTLVFIGNKCVKGYTSHHQSIKPSRCTQKSHFLRHQRPNFHSGSTNTTPVQAGARIWGLFWLFHTNKGTKQQKNDGKTCISAANRPDKDMVAFWGKCGPIPMEFELLLSNPIKNLNQKSLHPFLLHKHNYTASKSRQERCLMDTSSTKAHACILPKQCSDLQEKCHPSCPCNIQQETSNLQAAAPQKLEKSSKQAEGGNLLLPVTFSKRNLSSLQPQSIKTASKQQQNSSKTAANHTCINVLTIVCEKLVFLNEIVVCNVYLLAVTLK